MPHTTTTPPALQDGDLLAAIDLGSNSFHMVIARYTLGQLRVIDRLRETVRMADGLDGKADCLPPHGSARWNAWPVSASASAMCRRTVRALATNTVRQLRSPQSFLVPAETALGHAIEVVSGREEAPDLPGRGPCATAKPGQRRLVIDIGGGSTEFIIGMGMQTLERESLQAGCIASTRRFFPGGKLSKKRWKDALAEIGREFQPFASKYRALGWQEALGSSGTHKAISEICATMKLSKGAITAEALPQLRDELLKAKKIDDIQLPGLSSDRRPIIAGGILVLEAAFQALGLQKLLVSKAAMREGILYDIVGRAGENDLRDESVAALSQRYGIDTVQADRVQDTALSLLEQVQERWKLDADDARMLGWAARLHELGLMIAHSGYHVHGSYVLEHSDIAGFSRQEQQMLAALVRSHRRSVTKTAFDALPERLLLTARRLAALLRLAVLLNRAHEDDPLPALELTADDNRLSLIVPQAFIDARPLLRADLIGETDGIAGLGIQFRPFVA
jgi:exopolyphosphatase/guanosine-5'-triphosphate,3'-diphosphate pyrophosphatase